MNSIRISAVGDIMPGDHYFTMGHGIGSIERKFGFDSMFGKDVRKIFSESDIVFGNLEGVLSDKSNKIKSFEKEVFRGSKSSAEGLSKIGFNLINIANNHILQHGEVAFWDTIDCLKKQNIRIVGLRDKSGGYYCEPAIIQVKGKTLGVLGYSAVPERYSDKNECYASYDERLVLGDISKIRKEADICIVSLHSGEEGTEY